MPIGGRWPEIPTPAGGHFLGSPAGAAGPVDAAGAPAAGPPGGPTWFSRTLSVTVGTGGLVAILPAPGPGVNYVVERLLVITSQSPTSIDVYSGSSAEPQNLADGLQAPASGTAYVMANGDSSIRLGSQDQLFIVFAGLTVAAGERARVQIRMEPV